MSGRFNPLASSTNAQDPDIIYYNADIINNSTANPLGSNSDPQVSIYAQRQYPILQDANDYMMSCIRFTTSGATRNLPLWMPIIQTASVSTLFTCSINGNQLTLSNLQQGSIGQGLTFTGVGTAQLPQTGGGVIIYPTPVTFTATISPSLPLPFPVVPGSVFTLSAPLPPITDSTGTTYYTYNLVNAQCIVGTSQTNPNLTVYSFTLETSGGGIAQQYLIWTPENVSIPPPSGSQNIITQSLDTDYYYGYTYSNFVAMANVALASLWAAIGDGTASHAPVLSRTTNSTSATIFTMTNNTSASPGDYNLYMNASLEALLPNFPLQFTNLPDGRTAKFNFANPAGGTALASVTQEYPGTSAWSPVESIVVTTSAVPIIPEQVSPPSVVGGSEFGITNALSPSAFQPIIADIAIDEVQGAENWRQDIIWKPSAEFQMVSLTNTSSPISVIDLAVWWRNRLDNNLYPLRLVNGSSVSVKLMFRRKQMGV
jgi:hypothetical protein